MTHWPAYKKWGDLSYIQKVAGARTVPIELGSHYAHSDYSQKLMTIADFIELHVIGGKLGYLAQHQLFEQVNLNFFLLKPTCKAYFSLKVKTLKYIYEFCTLNFMKRI